jgi:hypothetical protein
MSEVDVSPREGGRLSRRRVLMILTHDRLDCLRLCLDMLERAEAFSRFDRVVLLLNGVPPRLRRFVERYMAARPQVAWDTVEGDGTRPEGICHVQNECIRRYPDSVYVKVDEDVFVPKGWAERLLATYDQYAARGDLALITPLIPNNAYGLHRLLNEFYPEALPEFEQRFGAPPSVEPKGATWQSPYIAEWASRLFLDIDAANAEQRRRLEAANTSRWHEFCQYFSIGCICYDYDHVQRMGGRVPPRDEPDWCAWFEENRQTCILDQSLIVLHYAFFVQQEWLDRTSLLEDIRRINLPGTSPWTAPLMRWVRLARQLPGIIRRRLGQ